MKKINIILSILALCASTLVSCNKEEALLLSQQESRDIVLMVKSDFDVQVQTKVTEVSSVPSSLYWSATEGTTTETSKWAPINAASVSSNGQLSTGEQQTANPTSYNYYLSNKPIVFGESGSTIAATNDTDIVAGKATSSAASVPIVLGHIFTRTGSLTLNPPSGYTISNVVWSLASASGSTTGTAGTYNIKTGAWSSTTALASTTITSSSDLYLVPGNYTLSVSYRLTKGNYQEDFNKSAAVILVAGKKNNITATAAAGNAQDINITITLDPWQEENLTPTFN